MSCGVTDIYVNQEIRVTFSDPINLSSVTNATFQVVDLLTGKTPAGIYSLDPGDDRVLIYRPQLTFDSGGNPIFGLTADSTYSVKIPGAALDLGPFIKNSKGAPNQNRLFCTLQASRGIFDAKPGAPRVTVTPVNAAVDVPLDSTISMVFDDLMNPGTVANPVSGESTTISIVVDPDGDTTDPTDQIAIPGSYTIALDQDALITTVVFTPEMDLPSTGASDPKRKIVVTLPNTIKDLGGNSLINFGATIFTTETLVFLPAVIAEDFTTGANEDEARTGSTWSSGGQFLPGSTVPTSGILGGGSGRLGDLHVTSGETVVLSTDTEDFLDDGDPYDPSIYDPDLIIDPTLFGDPETVVGGVFEFANLTVSPGGTLRFEGTNAARVYVRGEIVIQGVVDMSGESSATQNGTVNEGGTGGIAAAGGGAGGRGGARPDGVGFILQGGIPNNSVADSYPDDVLDPLDYVVLNGLDGGGIPYPNTLGITDYVAFGEGGLAWPQPTTTYPDLHFPADVLDVGGMEFDEDTRCGVRSPGGAGGGGGHSLSGLNGIPRPEGVFLGPVITPPQSEGGSQDDLYAGVNLATLQSLNPDLGFLRGGGGGGGGGGHLQKTRNNGKILETCLEAAGDPPPALAISEFASHSGGGGGGAGGGLQLQAGRRLILSGVIDAGGGNGAGNSTSNNSFATPGGGGAGGALLIQSQLIQVQLVPGRFSIEGGNGGLGVNLSTGGIGSPGFLRMESFDPLNYNTEASKLLPSATSVASIYGASLTDIFFVDDWEPTALGSSATSGGQSCWIRASGSYFLLDFYDDDFPSAGDLGWDMDVVISGFGVQSWRGDNDIYGVSLEEQFGSALGAAPLVVRFQGARNLSTLDDACNVALHGVDSPVFPGSVTEWVEHPSMLNDYFPGEPAKRSNMIRFLIVWDASQVGYDQITGIEEVSISVQPD